MGSHCHLENFEKVTLGRAAYKYITWFHYFDNMFVIWPHVPEKLNDFLNYLSSIHTNQHPVHQRD